MIVDRLRRGIVDTIRRHPGILINQRHDIFDFPQLRRDTRRLAAAAPPAAGTGASAYAAERVTRADAARLRTAAVIFRSASSYASAVRFTAAACRCADRS